MSEADAIFGNHLPPRDLVRGPGLTRADLIAMNAAVGTVVTGEIAGEVLLDVDGIPNAVGPSEKVSSYCGGIVVSSDQLHALGLTRQDVPNVTVLDRKETK